MAALTTLAGVSGLNVWYSTKDCNAQLLNTNTIQSWGRLFKYYPYSASYHGATLNQYRVLHWLSPTYSIPTTPKVYVNGSSQINSYTLWSSPSTMRYTSEPSWWPIIQTNSHGNFAALRFTNKRYWQFNGGEYQPGAKNTLQFIVVKRNGLNNSQFAGGNVLSPNGFLDEEQHQTLIGSWTQQYGLENYGKFFGYAIAADTDANNLVLMAKYSPTYSSTPYIAKSSVSFPTTPSILCQYIFRGQMQGLRLNGQNLAHNALPADEANIPNPPFGQHQKASYLIGGQVSQYASAANSRNQWAYWSMPLATVNHAEQDVYEVVNCTKDTPYTTQEIIDIEEYLGQIWSIPVSSEPLPLATSTPQSIFDVFKRGNETGYNRFKRMRLLGYV